MQKLELHTMIFMLAVVTILMGGLLAIASLHAGNKRGIRHWAFANFCIGLAFSLDIIDTLPSAVTIIVGATLVALGQCLQYSGIQLFKFGFYNRKLPFILTSWIFLQSAYFMLFVPDIEIRAMLNSLVLALINILCARQLLIKIDYPMRTAYWLSGISFAFFALLLLARFGNLWWHYPGHYTLMTPVPLNQITFFFGSICQLLIAFGFVLMLNYTLANKLEKQVHTDELTGALNRRALEVIGKRLCAQFKRTGNPLSLLILDIDHFKRINDAYGHATGDAALRKFSGMAQLAIRQGDYFARYGGEEFCILLPDTSAEIAQVIAERIRIQYSELVVIEMNHQPVYSTLSIGIADLTRSGADFETLVKDADQALYQAKNNGRNRVCLAHSSDMSEYEATGLE